MPESLIGTGGAGRIGVVRQYDTETLDYRVDYSSWLGASETIVSVTHEVKPVMTPALLVNSLAVVSGGKSISFVLKNGGPNQRYNVSLTITTSTGQINTDILGVRVALRPTPGISTTTNSPQATAAADQAIAAAQSAQTSATAAGNSAASAGSFAGQAEGFKNAAAASASAASSSTAAVTGLVAQALTYRNEAGTSATNADTSKNAAAASATAASGSATSAATSATNSASSAAAALSHLNNTTPLAAAVAADRAQTNADRVQTGIDRAAVAADRTQTASDRVATAADRVQTGLDQAVTASDRVQTGLDRAAAAASAANALANLNTTSTLAANVTLDKAQTAADRVQTGLDRVQTGLDRVATGQDRTATAADRVQTGLDRVATGQDKTGTAADRVQTGLDRVATAADRVQTGLDRVQTGLDRTASATSVTTAQTARSGAEAAQIAAAGSLASATQQAMTAQAQASLAAGHAASASAVAQLDVSGVNAAALHRSPNAISSMFIYDTSKDSDGGAWTEKCQHTSWYNEPLMGRWLGAHASEQFARLSNATFGNELIVNSDFSNGTTGWTPTAGSSASAASGVATFNGGNASYPSFVSNGLTTVIGRQYVVRARARQVSGNTAYFAAGNSPGFGGNTIAVSGNTALVYAPTVQEFTLGFVATATTTYAGVFGGNGSSTIVVEIDSFSVREVTAINTASGDYFQLTTDGKFYRLWKNLIRRSELFSDAVWQPAGVTISAGVSDPFGGTNASTLTATGVNGGITQVYSALAGSPTTNSIYIRRRTGTGVVRLYTPAAAATTLTLTSDWQRVSTTSTSTGTNYFIVNMATVGDAVDVAFAQAEIGSVVTAYEAKTTEVTTTETFRGNKADFPKLAAVVGENTFVTIYDLNEPGRPMWMRFISTSNSTANGMMLMRLGQPQGMFVLNGRMGVAGQNDQATYSEVNFPTDSGFSMTNNQNWSGVYRGNIAQRNADLGRHPSTFPILFSGPEGRAVAMTVLPDAPLDPITGLRVPTIAVASNGGVSVIRHDGVIRNSVSTGSHPSVTIIGTRLFFNRSGAGDPVYQADLLNIGASFGTSIMDYLSKSVFPSRVNTGGKTLTVYSDRTPGSVSRMVIGVPASIRAEANIRATHNTGWLPGDIRRAYLSDVGAGAVAEQANHSANLAAATLVGTGTWTSNADGSYTFTDTVGGQVRPGVQFATLGINQTYEVQFTVVSQSGTMRATGYAGGANIFPSTPGTYRFLTTPTSDAGTVQFVLESAGTSVGNSFRLSNVSIRRAMVFDRSYKALSITPFGTLTKAQLATGTSLVGYSGWSASNYLREAYSADLEFGTGEWSCSAWANVPATLPAISFTNVGSELVSNGTFAVDAAGWTSSATWTATVSVASGVATVTSGPTGIGRFIAPLSCVVGRTYLFKARFAKGTGGGARVYIPTASNGSGETAPPLINGSTTLTELSGYFTATASTMYIALMVDGGGNGATALFDDISVFEVAPAAIAERAHSSGPRIALGVVATGQLVATAFDGATTRTVITASAYNTATWLKAEACYTVDGSLSIRVNGREVAVTRGNPLLSLNSRYNLLNYSEALNSQSKNNMTITDGALASPVDGTMSLSNVVPTGTGAKSFGGQTVVSGVWTGRPFAMRFIAKANGYSKIVVGDGHGNSFPGQFFTFDLVAGTTNHANATLVDLGSGFWECRILIPSSTSIYNMITLTICPYPDGASVGYSGATFTANGSGTYIGQVQAENWTTWRAYQKTTTVAETLVAPLTIGNSFATDAPFPGSIALLKLGATVPTADQSLFMYEQEKQMFRAGAQTVLPDVNPIIDMAYDDATDRWVAISSSNESYWTGLVRNSVTAVPSGSYSKVAATLGVELIARATTTPGVDINMPPLGLREEFARRAEAAAKASRDEFVYDFVGGFTATTVNGNTAITSVANLSYPTSYIGARVSGSGIPTNTTIVSVSGTTIYLSAAATASASNVSISFLDFALPVGMTAKTVISAGAVRQEGATKDFTRLWDGFYETIRFGVAPGVTAWVQIQATRDAAQ